MSPVGPWDPVERLRGVGEKLGGALREAGAPRVVELLLHLPARYEDRSRVEPLASARRAVGRKVLVRAVVGRVRQHRGRGRRQSRVEAVLEDSGATLAAVWFNQPWVGRRLEGAGRVWAYGPVRLSRAGVPELVNPELEEVADGPAGEGIVPVYPRLGPFGGRRLRRLEAQARAVLPLLEDPLPEGLRRRLDLPDLAEALARLHEPALPGERLEAEGELARLGSGRSRWHERLALDELLAFACGAAAIRRQRAAQVAPSLAPAEPVDHLARRLLPFALTPGQRRAAGEIVHDLAGPRPMARLLQGDVGCGKTAVAALAMSVAAQGGFQAVLMAPTELLAEQHHRTLTELLAGAGLAPVLLTGSLRPAEQRAVRAALAAGEARLAVGTHALVQESVGLARLGLAVVDEQQRFGVAQRQALVDKGRAPHLLVMTATPIPRSLALTVHGDLDLSVVDDLPPGRQPVTTVIRPVAARPRLYSFLRREVGEGGRAYVVCPLIDPSPQLAARALAEHGREVQAALPGVAVALLHGRMAAAERAAVAEAFRHGRVQVLVATSLVEVGVDVPEATVMVVESPERFGLSQLHQLRGRVGRGRRRSYCALVVDDELEPEALARLERFCAAGDGFEIAELDLALRGPGELAGLRQWGRGWLRFADLQRHQGLAALARRLAGELAERGELDRVRSALARLHPCGAEIGAG